MGENSEIHDFLVIYKRNNWFSEFLPKTSALSAILRTRDEINHVFLQRIKFAQGFFSSKI